MILVKAEKCENNRVLISTETHYWGQMYYPAFCKIAGEERIIDEETYFEIDKETLLKYLTQMKDTEFERQLQHTGEKCLRSGLYKCLQHSQTIPLSKGEIFPPCRIEGGESHGADWELIIQS